LHFSDGPFWDPQLPWLPADLEIVKQSKGPVMTVVEEFYKVGPGLVTAPLSILTGVV
jgi:hypothetical protein